MPSLQEHFNDMISMMGRCKVLIETINQIPYINEVEDFQRSQAQKLYGFLSTMMDGTPNVHPFIKQTKTFVLPERKVEDIAKLTSAYEAALKKERPLSKLEFTAKDFEKEWPRQLAFRRQALLADRVLLQKLIKDRDPFVHQ